MRKLTHKKSRSHYTVTLGNILKMLGWFQVELFSHLPELWELRKIYKNRVPNPEDLSVALIGDNLDEVNGIALSSRTLIRTQLKKNRKIYLVGIAFHNKNPRMEMRGGSIVMIPGLASMDQPGYSGSEVAIPKIGLMLRLLKRYPIDLFEFETPNTMGFMALCIAKFIGIKTISHYRTDLLTYLDLLIQNKLGKWILHKCVIFFTWASGPVIVPSRAFKDKVAQMGIPKDKIHQLPRGVDQVMFHPDKKNNGAWEKLLPEGKGFRLIYMGRISREKNLPWLCEFYRALKTRFHELRLTVVGEGPYLEEMKRELSSFPEVFFTGTLRGQNLAGVLASSDVMLFPSTTDTFGNSVIEALASGVPCLVSNEGGPQEIVENGSCGFVVDPKNQSEAVELLAGILENPEALKSMKENARKRAQVFTHENSADRFWAFYQSLFEN